MIKLQETIRPSADLRNHYSDISRQCKENKEAVIITVNGRGDTVTLSYEEYKNMMSEIPNFNKKKDNSIVIYRRRNYIIIKNHKNR